MERLDPIEPDEAVKILLDLAVKPDKEDIPLSQALKRVLAEDTYACMDVPGFDKSAVDGYALGEEDMERLTRGEALSLDVIEEIPAGYGPTKALEPGQASKVLTGAKLPQGADFIIKFEDVESHGVFIKIQGPLPRGSNIIRAGADLARGDLLARDGDVLNPILIGILASQGISSVRVYKRPRIGIGAIGSELADSSDHLGPAMIYETNRLTLEGILQGLGFETHLYEILRDEPEAIRDFLKKAVDEVDIVITTGGASVGDYDFALRSVEDLGSRVLFWRTLMRPGGPMVASQYKGKIILGLSGNPTPALLALYRIGLPFLKKSLGMGRIFDEKIDLILKDDLKARSGLMRLVWGRISYEGGRAYFVESPSAGPFSFLDSDCLVEIPTGSGALKAGTLVEAYKLGSLFA